MGKLEDYDCGSMVLKILTRLPYRLECKLEELIIKMGQGIEGKLSEFDDIDFNEMEMSDLKGFDISKKIAINDFLLTNVVYVPKLTLNDLDDDEHILNNKFKQIGDYLFDKYLNQYAEKNQEKKKLTKSPVLEQTLPDKLGH